MVENKDEQTKPIEAAVAQGLEEVGQSTNSKAKEAEKASVELVGGYEVATVKTDTKQSELIRNSKGQIIGGTPPAGFNVNPQNRSDGRWKPEQSISYLYNKFGRMTEDELEAYREEKEGQLTRFEKIALARVKAAEDSLNDAKEITDRTEGKAPQSIDMTSKGESINPYSALTTEELRKMIKE